MENKEKEMPIWQMILILIGIMVVLGGLLLFLDWDKNRAENKKLDNLENTGEKIRACTHEFIGNKYIERCQWYEEWREIEE